MITTAQLLARLPIRDRLRKEVITLYRSMLRESPRLMAVFRTTVKYEIFRGCLRYQFDRNKSVQDIRLIEMLLTLGYCEFKEVLLQHKLKDHIVQYLSDYEIVLEEKKAQEKAIASHRSIV